MKARLAIHSTGYARDAYDVITEMVAEIDRLRQLNDGFVSGEVLRQLREKQ